jgi:hypothetical protein
MNYQYNPKWKSNMTDAMLLVVEDLNQGVEQELALCDQKIEEARAVWLSEEKQTTEGKIVTHGAALDIKAVMLYWSSRRKLLLDLMGISERDYLMERQ